MRRFVFRWCQFDLSIILIQYRLQFKPFGFKFKPSMLCWGTSPPNELASNARSLQWSRKVWNLTRNFQWNHFYLVTSVHTLKCRLAICGSTNFVVCLSKKLTGIQISKLSFESLSSSKGCLKLQHFGSSTWTSDAEPHLVTFVWQTAFAAGFQAFSKKNRQKFFQSLPKIKLNRTQTDFQVLTKTDLLTSFLPVSNWP